MSSREMLYQKIKSNTKKPALFVPYINNQQAVPPKLFNSLYDILKNGLCPNVGVE